MLFYLQSRKAQVKLIYTVQTVLRDRGIYAHIVVLYMFMSVDLTNISP